MNLKESRAHSARVEVPVRGGRATRREAASTRSGARLVWPSAVLSTMAGLLAASCAAEETRTAFGVTRDAESGCVEQEVVYELKSTYGGAELIETPPEWCGLIEGEMVCFLDGDNDPKFSGVHLARSLSEGSVPRGHASLSCWAPEIANWDLEWAGSKYHPVWETRLNL